jgi:hypothetical protein
MYPAPIEEIESMFETLKPGGLDLEATGLTEPNGIERRIGLLAVSFSWTPLVGSRLAQPEGPPPDKTQDARSGVFPATD